MKRIVLSSLLVASFIFTGCADKEPVKQDYKTTNEVLGTLNNLNNSVNTAKAQDVKVNTYIVKNPEKSQALRTAPKVMETLFLGYVDSKDNRVSDYFVNTVIHHGDWVGANNYQRSQKNLGGLND